MCFAEISSFQNAQGPHELTGARKLITQVETRSNSKTVANPVRDELLMLEWAGVLAKRSNNPAGIHDVSPGCEERATQGFNTKNTKGTKAHKEFVGSSSFAL